MHKIFSLVGALLFTFGCADDSGGDELPTETKGATTGAMGDGDGDASTGDGDGDPSTTTGDGDGDTSTGDGDGDGDTSTGDGDGDGDGSCDLDGLIATGIGQGNPWMEGTFCDVIYVCVSDPQAEALMAEIDGIQCSPESVGCEDIGCTLASHIYADADTIADACTALGIDGIDEVYCIVYGP